MESNWRYLKAELGLAYTGYGLIARLLDHPFWPNVYLMQSAGTNIWGVWHISDSWVFTLLANGAGPGNFPYGFAVEPD